MGNINEFGLNEEARGGILATVRSDSQKPAAQGRVEQHIGEMLPGARSTVLSTAVLVDEVCSVKNKASYPDAIWLSAAAELHPFIARLVQRMSMNASERHRTYSVY